MEKTGRGGRMTKAILVLRNITVENANAINGLTWGFPAISNFLGYTHAIERKLPKKAGLTLTGCGVICHKHSVQAYQPKGWGDYYFGLTRNPLTQKEQSPAFIEEGRMHMTVSLVIPVEGDLDAMERADLIQAISDIAQTQRLAGGTITSMGWVELMPIPEDDEVLKKFERRVLRRLIPGFALIQRSDLLASHVKESGKEVVDAFMDFSALKYEATQDGEEVTWQKVSKPGDGWLVPISLGFRSISPIYQPGKVANLRDSMTPFRFAESVYSIGEWVSPHRAKTIQDIIWKYSVEENTGFYLTTNHFQPSSTQKGE